MDLYGEFTRLHHIFLRRNRDAQTRPEKAEIDAKVAAGEVAAAAWGKMPAAPSLDDVWIS